MEECKVHVGSLSYDTDEESLDSFFKNKIEVEVVDVKVVRDRETGKSRGFGFVTLGSPEDVDAALDFKGDLELDGRTVVISKAKPRGDSGGGGRRSGYRGGRGGYGGGGGGGGRYGGGGGYSGGGGYDSGRYDGGSGGNYGRSYSGGQGYKSRGDW